MIYSDFLNQSAPSRTLPAPDCRTGSTQRHA